MAVHALVDAADDDSGTGGPDRARRIWPSVAVVDAAGYRRIDDATLAEVVGLVEDARAAHGGERA